MSAPAHTLLLSLPYLCCVDRGVVSPFFRAFNLASLCVFSPCLMLEFFRPVELITYKHTKDEGSFRCEPL